MRQFNILQGAGFAEIMRKNRESAAAKASIHGSPNSNNASSAGSTTQTTAYAASYTGSNSGNGNGNDKYGSSNNNNNYNDNSYNNNINNNNNIIRSSSSSTGYRADPGSPIPASVGSGTEGPIRTRAIPGVRESRTGTGIVSGSGSVSGSSKSPHFSSPNRSSSSSSGGEERQYDSHLGGPKQAGLGSGSGSQSIFGIASDMPGVGVGVGVVSGGQGQGRSQSRGTRSTHDSPTNAEIASRLISIENKLDRLLKHLGI